MKNQKSDLSRFRQETRQRSSEIDYRHDMENLFAASPGSNCEKLENFPKYVSRQSMARFLALYEIFKLALEIQGDIIECGVNWGGGLMSFAQFSAVFEPVNMQRRIIGFDTFAGFPSIAAEDGKAAVTSSETRAGGFAAESYEDLLRCIELYDANRTIGHIGKVILVKGDATESIPEFLEANPHTVVSLLHLDFDIYAPTKAALEHLVPRIPKGGVIVFDELNNPTWPGETVAVSEILGLNNLRIRRFEFEPHISYAIVE